MALGRRSRVADEAPGNENAVAVIPTSSEGAATMSSDETATHGVDVSGDDTLPMEIPDEDLQAPKFDKTHREVRAVISKPRIEKASPGTTEKKADWWYREGKDTFALVCDFMIRGDQPSHPELTKYKGVRLSFNRFIIASGQRGQETYLAICKAWGMDPKRPDCRLIEDVPCILSITTVVSNDKLDPEKTYTNHNINRVIRDLEFEAQHNTAA